MTSAFESRRPRRVLLANVSLANGGLERQLLLLARNLPSWWTVRLWTLEGGPYEESFKEAGIPWRCRRRHWRSDPLPAIDLGFAMRDWRPDIVHAWHWMPAAAAVPSARLLGIPLVDGSIRMGSVPRDRGRPRRSIMRWATVVVANSQAGLDAWRVGPEKGRVVYNAFDEERLRADQQSRASATTHDRLTAVMAARMDDPQKDYGVVLEAARLLEGRSPGTWRFLLVGNQARRSDSLVSAAAGLVDAGVVTFVDAGLEPIGVVRTCDVGVLMTDPAVRAEGCSNAIMEYMACGLPVVCSDTGGSSELVHDGREGYVIAPHDAEGLAARLHVLALHPELRSSMGAAGRRRITREFSVERMVSDYVGIYEDAIERYARIR
jgi:glycosyltransferase involved in cell wall biosynthesis